MLKSILFGAALAVATTSVMASEGHDHGHSMHESMHGGGAFAFGQPVDPGAASRTVAVNMGDMSFSPAAITVKTGEAVRFVVTNSSGVDHDFTLGDAQTQAAHRQEMAQMADHGGETHGHDGMGNAIMVKAGETKTLGWRFTQPGALEFDCNVPGHFESGMTGKITVTP